MPHLTSPIDGTACIVIRWVPYIPIRFLYDVHILPQLLPSTYLQPINCVSTAVITPLPTKCYKNKCRAAPGIEPGTSRTLSENHTTRPSSRQTYMSYALSRHFSAIPISQSNTTRLIMCVFFQDHS